MSLISRAKFIVANDTGPAHIASHLDKKGIALFGSHTTAKKVSIENLIYEYEECYLKNKIVYFLKKYMKKTLKFKNIENKTKKIKY